MVTKEGEMFFHEKVHFTEQGYGFLVRICRCFYEHHHSGGNNLQRGFTHSNILKKIKAGGIHRLFS